MRPDRDRPDLGAAALDIRDDLVLVSQEDALDVESAVMFRLVAPAGSTET